MTPRRPTRLSAALRGMLPVLDGGEDHLTGTIVELLAWLPVDIGLRPLLGSVIGVDRAPPGWGAGVASVDVARGGFRTADARGRFLPFGVPAAQAAAIPVRRVANVPGWSIGRPEVLGARFDARVADWQDNDLA